MVRAVRKVNERPLARASHHGAQYNPVALVLSPLVPPLQTTPLSLTFSNSTSMSEWSSLPRHRCSANEHQQVQTLVRSRETITVTINILRCLDSSLPWSEAKKQRIMPQLHLNRKYPTLTGLPTPELWDTFVTQVPQGTQAIWRIPTCHRDYCAHY